LEQVQNHRR